MSNINELSDLMTKMEKEEIQQEETEKYFAEQDQKFEDLYKKLTDLKIESQKHMDTIVHTLDDLIESKKVVEETLEAAAAAEETPLELPGAEDINLSVTDLLSKITGLLHNTGKLLNTTENKIIPDVSTDALNDMEMENSENSDIKFDRKEVEKELKTESTVNITDISELKNSSEEKTIFEETKNSIDTEKLSSSEKNAK